MANTPHRGIPYPGSPTTEAPKICAEFEALAKFFDHDAPAKEGTVAERTAWEENGKKQVSGRLFFVSTAGIEYGLWWDNGTTWLQLVSSATIPNEAVTDAKVVKGRALVETESSWKSLAYTKGETITPNASRETAVSIEVLGEDNELVAIQVSVNGQSVGEAVGGPIEGRHTQIVFPTIVPANQTLKVGGSYTIINIKALTR